MISAELILAAVLVVIAGLLFPSISCGPIPATVVRAKNDTMQIYAALKHYHSEFGVMPAGDHIAIIKALLGRNPQKIVFIEFKPSQKSSQGHFLDP